MAKGRSSRELVRIAEGRATSLGKAKNRTLGWGELGDTLSTPTRTKESFKAFLKLPKDEQDRLKATNGWILGGPISGDRRRKVAIRERDLLTFDCDAISPKVLRSLLNGKNPICDFEFYLHTTRKHQEDAPRVRLFFLLAEPVPADHYVPLSRITASEIDPSMEGVDKVSFRVAQMMFLPTASRDSEFIFHHNQGDLLDPMEMLESWPHDWRDYASLPHAESESKLRKTAAKAENPEDKRGVVGAFCRAYDVEAAIEEFLPDIYLPGDTPAGGKPRYSYALGSTTNGVVVEDDGLFIYSHHGTDPCGDRLCNAFDMVRLHLFGDEDEGKDDDTPVRDLPSFKAMVGFAKEQKAVRKQIVADRVDMAAMFSDLDDDDVAREDLEDLDGGDTVDDEIADLLRPKGGGGHLPQLNSRRHPKKPKKTWPQDELEVTPDGFIKPTVHNIGTIISNDYRTWGVIGRNLFSQKIMARRTLKSKKLPLVTPVEVDDPQNGLEWSDIHDVSVRAILEAPAGDGNSGWGILGSDRNIRDAVLLVAQRWSFHPVKEWLEGLTWDGKRRLDRLWIDYLGTPDEPYYRQTARLFLIAAIARIYRPGHKWDFAPILSGRQGIRKSSFVKALFGRGWSAELTAQIASNKDAVEQMLGIWALELPELANIRKSEAEDVKMFLTLEFDRVRLAYDRRMSTFYRQCVFVGTTNAKEYLKDPTGNRRFWPIPVNERITTIDTDKLIREREQIFAEAFHVYLEMCRNSEGGYKALPLHLTGEALETAMTLQDAAREESPEEGQAATILEWLDRPVPVSTLEHGAQAVEFAPDEDEPWAVRTQTCLTQVYCEALGGDLRSYASNRTLAHNIGLALQRVPGWRYSGRRSRIAGYGLQRIWEREDRTAEERIAGYRLVEDSETGARGSPGVSADEEDDLDDII